MSDVVLVLAVLLILVLALVWALRNENITWGPPRRRRPRRRRRPPPAPGSLEAKLATLADHGLSLARPFTPVELLSTWDREAFEREGYLALVVALAMAESKEPFRHRCETLWYFDPECVEGDGAYAEIAERLAEMADGDLPLENVRDYVDVENDEAWLAFTLEGQRHRIDLEINDDWIDPTVFTRLDDLLSGRHETKNFALQFTSGQHIVVACLTEAQRAALNELEGIDFREP